MMAYANRKPFDRFTFHLSLILSVLQMCMAAVAVECDPEPHWSNDIGNPGMDHIVTSLTTFDDGTGPALYVAGGFSMAGGQPANRIAKWDKAQWWPLGAGTDLGIRALAVFDDGAGPALYAGGPFTFAGAQPANRIAKWDGEKWSTVGDGFTGGSGMPTVLALAVYDDGSGSALYAAGDFATSGSLSVNRIARWDSNRSEWMPLGSGLNFRVEALAVFDDGSGPALYAGGMFTTAGGQPANRIARWNGNQWSSLGSGIGGSLVTSLTVYDDGTGPALIAGGAFVTAGGASANFIAKWNGVQWLPLGTGLGNSVGALAVFDDGTGHALYAGGVFTTTGDGIPANRIAKWDGSQWLPVGAGVTGNFGGGIPASVEAMTGFEDGGGPALYVGGRFTTAGSLLANYVAAWVGCPVQVEPPIALCDAYPTFGDFDLTGDGILVECDGPEGREIVLDASASHDPADLTLTFQWNVPPMVVLDDPNVAIATGFFPVGSHLAAVTVANDAGESSTCEIVIHVEDSTAPVVTVTTSASTLWPPNHTMRDVHVVISAFDLCEDEVFISPITVWLSSNESDNAKGNGDGNTIGDCHGHDCFSEPLDVTSAFVWDANYFGPGEGAWVGVVQLRAERAAAGSGRVYTIEVQASDSSGNVSINTALVTVPKSVAGGLK